MTGKIDTHHDRENEGTTILRNVGEPLAQRHTVTSHKTLTLIYHVSFKVLK